MARLMEIHAAALAVVQEIVDTPDSGLVRVDSYRVENYELDELPAARVRIDNDELVERSSSSDIRQALLVVDVTGADIPAPVSVLVDLTETITEAILGDPGVRALVLDLGSPDLTFEVEKGAVDIGRVTITFPAQYRVAAGTL